MAKNSWITCHFIVVVQCLIPKDKTGASEDSKETAYLLNEK